MPSIHKASTDTSHYTRAALGSVIMGVAAVLTKQQILSTLLPLFLHLLKDKHPDVRLNVIARLETLSEVVGLELLSQSLLPAIVELATDTKWRVRLAICGHIPALAQQLGTAFYEQKLDALCTTWLGDTVFSVRKAAAENLTKLAKVFGSEWACANIVPKVEYLATQQSCLFRLTALQAGEGLCTLIGADNSANLLLPILLPLCADVVPNVRFNAAKTLGAVGLAVSPVVASQVVSPRLQKMASDSDKEVVFHAQQSLADLKTNVQGSAAPSEAETKLVAALTELISAENRQQPEVLPRAKPRTNAITGTSNP